MINPAIVLFAWPLISLGIFAGLGVVRGFIAAILVGYLLLPENFMIDVPLLPPYDKRTAITAGLMLALFAFRKEFQEVASESRSVDKPFSIALGLCAVVLLLIPAFVFLTNRSPLFFGPTVLPAHTPKDVISGVWTTLVVMMPFFFARRILTTEDSHRMLLQALLAAGFIYSFLALFELRMSPQLNNWIYGYFPHQWLQHIRGGGFRPVIFLKHGLWLGFFLLSVVLAAIALSRTNNPTMRMAYLMLAFWMFAVLFLSRNLGATLLGIMFVPVVLFLGRRLQLLAATVVACLFLSYPILLQSNALPIDRFLSAVEQASPKRAQSLETRLINDQRFLERAQEKPVFGWGRYGRWRVYDETGRDVSIADGLWIILLGTTGWVGYIGFFGLFILPVVALYRVRKRKELTLVTTGMAVIMAANFVYLIPNSALNTIGYAMAGALAGFIQFDLKRARQKTEDADTQERRVRYTRFERPGAPVATRQNRQTYSRANLIRREQSDP
ncbi:MAG: hypothetical protein AAFY14_00470 [Pseudomonadota bacterium]